MNIKDNKYALLYTAITLTLTFLVGQIILVLFPKGNSLGSSILFILINLLPMIMAIICSKINNKNYSIAYILKDIFIQKESLFSYTLSFCFR